jgi:hypothetical protein
MVGAQLEVQVAPIPAGAQTAPQQQQHSFGCQSKFHTWSEGLYSRVRSLQPDKQVHKTCSQTAVGAVHVLLGADHLCRERTAY